VWNNNLYLFAQMLFKPAGSVVPPPSIGSYNGEPVGGFGGTGAPGMGRGGRTGAGAPGGGASSEFVARREKGGSASAGVAGTWLAKDGDNEMKFVFKVDGSKLTGTIENTQMPGAIEFKDGKVEGNKISFGYVRQMMGQDFQMKWTGTLSGDEIKLKRELAGGGTPGIGRGVPPGKN
jgi:hypothetical protein